MTKKRTQVVKMRPNVSGKTATPKVKIDEKTTCEMEGCSNTGVLMDGDGIMKCQECLGKELVKQYNQKSIRITKNDPCPCTSGKKFRYCCGDMKNKLRQWYLKRVGKVIFYKNKPDCPDPECENCKKCAEGILITDILHARLLYEYTVESGVKFKDRKDDV